MHHTSPSLCMDVYFHITVMVNEMWSVYANASNDMAYIQCGEIYVGMKIVFQWWKCQHASSTNLVLPSSPDEYYNNTAFKFLIYLIGTLCN